MMTHRLQYLLAAISLVSCLTLNYSVAETVVQDLDKKETFDGSSILTDGRRVYNFRCYYCHGYSGDAKTLAARFMNPKPRDFTAGEARLLSRNQLIDSVRHGSAGTAMKPFQKVLSEYELKAVVEYVQQVFIDKRAQVPGYHTQENGWPHHERYRVAFPFATGEIPLDLPPDSLTADQRRGLQLYLKSCVSCHDRSRVNDVAVYWKPDALSYPRLKFAPGDSLKLPDKLTGATSFAKHDRAPILSGLSAQEASGQALYQDNCAFCHAADGTAKNWIGTFLEPPPRNLTDPDFMRLMASRQLKERIQNGLPGTSMPAWRHVLKEREIDAIVAYIHRAFYPLSDDVVSD